MNRRTKRRRSLAILIVLAAAWALLAPWLPGLLVIERPLRHSDVILVLGGPADYLPRAMEAAFLYREGVAPRIVLTNDGQLAGWVSKEQRTPPFVELSKQRLVAQGVPENAVEILAPIVSGTIAEARLVAEKAAEGRWDSLLIVTSAHHTRRALRTFEREFSGLGLATRIGIVPALNGYEQTPAAYWWLTPTGWRDIAWEYLKSAYYFVAYW